MPILIVIVLIIIVVVLIVKGKKSKYDGNSLIGTFYYEEGNTKYTFNADGTGKMSGASFKYEYTYEADGKLLNLDFKDKEIKKILNKKDRLEERLKSFSTQFANFHLRYASETWHRKNIVDAVSIYDFIYRHKNGTFIDVEKFAQKVHEFLDKVDEIRKNSELSSEYANKALRKLYSDFYDYLANELDKIQDIIDSYENLPEQVKTKCDAEFKANKKSESFSSYIERSSQILKRIKGYLTRNTERIDKLLSNNSRKVKTENFESMYDDLNTFLQESVVEDENGKISSINDDFNFSFLKAEGIIESVMSNFFIDPAIKFLYRELTKEERLVYDFVKTVVKEIEETISKESIAKKTGNNSGLNEFLNILTEFNERLKNKTLYQNIENTSEDNLIIRLSDLVKAFDGYSSDNEISKQFNDIVRATGTKITNANGEVIVYDFSESPYEQKLIRLRQGFNYFAGAVGKMFFSDAEYFSDYMFITKQKAEEENENNRNKDIEDVENDIRKFGIQNYSLDAIPKKIKNGLVMIKDSLQIKAVNSLSGDLKQNSVEYSFNV